MRRLIPYFIPFLLALLVPGLSGCERHEAERVDWTVSLDHTKKTPYASSLAYDIFPDYFPGAKRESLTRYFRYTAVRETDNAYADSVHMMVLLGLDFRLSDAEWMQLLRFVKNGNEVFLLSASLDPKICRDLRLRERHMGSEKIAPGFMDQGESSGRSLSIGTDTATRYGYSGRYIDGWFETGVTGAERFTSDTYADERSRRTSGSNGDELRNNGEYALLRASIDTAAEVLGNSKQGPDFIRYRVGYGHLSIHAAPLALSNYFLLQPENRPYLDAVWHQFPANISRVYWNEYFERKAEQSSLWSLFRFPAMRYALIIAALTLLLYVAFSVKRRQRIVPVIPPLENASVSFVETVGRLYFNKGDHLNLAAKMVQHFLEWVRGTYYLDTSKLDKTFVEQLSLKSGRSAGEVQVLVDIIHGLRNGTENGSPEFLQMLYRRIRIFYKNVS